MWLLRIPYAGDANPRYERGASRFITSKVAGVENAMRSMRRTSRVVRKQLGELYEAKGEAQRAATVA